MGGKRTFWRSEAAPGVLLMAAAAAAVAIANSPLAPAYHDVLHDPLAWSPLGKLSTLHLWINDAAMAVFFFVVGLEIKREVLVGEMRSPRQAALAIAAAVGGVTVPALLFMALNPAGPSRAGWGIPIGTDTAFALGIITLFGGRVRPILLVFLTAFSIVDDILAVGVIAVPERYPRCRDS